MVYVVQSYWACSIHLRTETDPVSKTLWYFLSSTYKTMDKVQNKPNSSVQLLICSKAWNAQNFSNALKK
jgi:hypothetical protein